ncbi:MAG: hypothetical protein EXR91_03000 [Gemmatimonadetes bacterium]|nr:hypothetical protein [Gemmatimonadota bacterium]
MSMSTLPRSLAGVALAGAMLMPASARAQSGAGPTLTPEEREAQQMGLELAVACNPRRQGLTEGSQSTIRRESDALAGTAILNRSAEGTFLSLEEYDEALEGHCLVFGWFGGDLAPGSYRISRLAYRTMEEDLASGSRSFFSWGAVRAREENSMLVAESGTLEIMTVEQGRITGSFELTGFVIDDGARTDVVWAGSFSAVEGEG